MPASRSSRSAAGPDAQAPTAPALGPAPAPAAAMTATEPHPSSHRPMLAVNFPVVQQQQQQQQQPTALQGHAAAPMMGHNHQPPPSEHANTELPAKPPGRPGGRIVAEPPNLAAWRELLFGVDGRIVLTNEQFETYFPHVDNVYSHRSTQRYKHKPFVSHYWDCRMKGRPPGTPKSDDPGKRKRKRTVRERDLCDVKIKITEFFPGADIGPEAGDSPMTPLGQEVGLLPLTEPIVVGPGQRRFWTIQRVNGNGNNGKGDGVAGPHRHSLATSDEIKRNSVQRHLAQQAKDAKKSPKQQQQQQQQPSPKATGPALATARRHSKDKTLKLFAACFCPFSQRVWIALEAKGLLYQYCEADIFQRPPALPLPSADGQGPIPAIRHEDWPCAESAVILEYLEDINSSVPLYPESPRSKANCRRWIGHIDQNIVPAFFAFLRADDSMLRQQQAESLRGHITTLVLAADKTGPLFLGRHLSLVDVHFAPFAIRLSRLLQPLPGWTEPSPEPRWHSWVAGLEANPHVQATTCSKELYTKTRELLAQISIPVA